MSFGNVQFDKQPTVTYKILLVFSHHSSILTSETPSLHNSWGICNSAGDDSHILVKQAQSRVKLADYDAKPHGITR